MFFRTWEKQPFHISDHLLAGKLTSLCAMFNTGLEKWKSGTYITPEVLLCRSFLDSIYEDEYGKVEMQKHFVIVNLEDLVPYKIVANCFGRIWENDFDLKENESISNIEEL